MTEFVAAKTLVAKWVGKFDVDAEFVKMDISGTG
jgi:hypothetical protein